jgi:hypothetical protein
MVNRTTTTYDPNNQPTLRAERILLAPLENCEQKLKDMKKPAEKWNYISKLGNSLEQPSRNYLSDEPLFKFPKCYIDLGAKFTLAREDMEHFVRLGKRMAALSHKNLAYLQSRLWVAFARTARDDVDWLSLDDLKTKIASLEDDIKKRRQSIASKESEFRKANSDQLRQNLEDEIAAKKHTLKELEYEFEVAKSAKETLAGPDRSIVPPSQTS